MNWRFMRGSGRACKLPEMIYLSKLAVCVALFMATLILMAAPDDAFAQRKRFMRPQVLLYPPVLAPPGRLIRPHRQFRHDVAGRRPSARAIDLAKRQLGLPPSARAVGWRMVQRGGAVYWKIIFRVGNRQIPVEIRVGR